MSVRARKVGMKWRGQYNFGGAWFPVKRSFRVVTFGTAEAARAAARGELDKIKIALRGPKVA